MGVLRSEIKSEFRDSGQLVAGQARSHHNIVLFVLRQFARGQKAEPRIYIESTYRSHHGLELQTRHPRLAGVADESEGPRWIATRDLYVVPLDIERVDVDGQPFVQPL